MSDFDVKEKRFEEDIESYLCSAGGYTKGNPSIFDRNIALDKNTFLTFIDPISRPNLIKYGTNKKNTITTC